MTITMQNAAKEGALFGARNPTCDSNIVSGCLDPQNVTARVTNELDGLTPEELTARCYVPGTSDFSGTGKALADCVDGDLYHVTVGATFHLATPLIGSIVGDSIVYHADATSVVISSFTAGGGPIDPAPTAAPTATPEPGTCTVPDFRNGTRINEAQDVWEDVAGFTTTVTTIGPGGQEIAYQERAAGNRRPLQLARDHRQQLAHPDAVADSHAQPDAFADTNPQPHADAVARRTHPVAHADPVTHADAFADPGGVHRAADVGGQPQRHAGPGRLDRGRLPGGELHRGSAPQQRLQGRQSAVRSPGTQLPCLSGTVTVYAK